MLICCRLCKLEFNQRGTIDKAIALAGRKLCLTAIQDVSTNERGVKVEHRRN